MLRSVDAAGAGGIVFSETSVDVYNPKTVRASAGSVFHVPVVRGASTIDAIARAKGAEPACSRWLPRARAISTAPTCRALWSSCSATKRRGCPTTSRPPPTPWSASPVGPAESLNLAAAATVCLFEWQRRRLRSGEALESIVTAAAHDIRSPLTAMKGFGYA